MLESIKKRSGKGPYKHFAKNFIKKYINSYEKKFGTDPSVVADIIYQAIISRNPSTRYPAGKYAKLFLFIRKILSDKLYDRLVLSQFGKHNIF